MTLKENFLRVIRHDNPEWIPQGDEAVYTIISPAVERPLHAGLDDWGVRHDLKDNADGGAYPMNGGHTITDLKKWRLQITIPDLDAMNWDAATQQAKTIDREQYLIGGFVDYGLFERSYLLLGMDNALVYYLTEPELMDNLVSAIADYKIKVIEHYYDAVKPDIIWYGDDWGTQRNLFLPPAIWRKIIKPHTKRVYDSMKEKGILVNQHSCGKIEAIFADIIEMGVDMLNPCQPCNDLAELKRKFAGRVTFWGGIDSQFVLDRPGVTTEEVRAEVRRRIDEMANGGGYIAAPSHSVPYDRELMHAMSDEIAVYGREFYQKSSRRLS